MASNFLFTRATLRQFCSHGHTKIQPSVFANNFPQAQRYLHSSSKNYEAVKLAFTSYENTDPAISNKVSSDETPIIIQHGLLGSRKNWASLGKFIHSRTGRKVIVADARNHGDSPHSPELNYQVLSEDVISLLRNHNIPKATLIGHSMGGRTMMAVALTEPSLVDRLVVVDISPTSVSPGAGTMQSFLTAMEQIKLGIPMKRTTARKVVDEQLQAVVKDALLRQFLLTNLVEDNGYFRWRVNLKAIISNLHNIIGEFPFKDAGECRSPTLFIGGGNSDYIRPRDHKAIQNIFPSAEFQYIPNAGHWVHSEKPAEFLEILLKFLNKT